MNSKQLNIIFLVIVVGLLGVVGWQYKKTNNEITQTLENNTQQTASGAVVSKQTNSKQLAQNTKTTAASTGNLDTLGSITQTQTGYLYQNSYYRFQLSMPDSWEGVNVVFKKGSTNPAIRYYSMALAPNNNAAAVTVAVVSQEDFKKLSANSTDPYRDLLSCAKSDVVQNDKFILCATGWQDLPDNKQATVQQISPSIPGVINSLKFY